MFVLIGICLVLLVMMFVFIFNQMVKQQKLNQIKNDKNSPSDLLEKLSFFEKIEDQKQRKYNQYNFLTMIISLFIVLSIIILLSSKIAYTKNQVQQLQEEIHTLKVEQKQLISKMPVKQYPEEGLELNKLEWKKIFDHEGSSKTQMKLETEVAAKMGPYFGISRVLTSVEKSPKSLSISLIGNTQEEENKKLIVRNIESFVQEVETIPQLMKIHIKVMNTEGKKNKTLINKTYSRQKSDDAFTIQKK